jgi:hypothetical protein
MHPHTAFFVQNVRVPLLSAQELAALLWESAAAESQQDAPLEACTPPERDSAVVLHVVHGLCPLS